MAFVVQRCGSEVNGGAETLCLQVAQQMQERWQIEILTTCARDYMRWENAYPAGTETVGGVVVRRYPVDAPRDVSAFDALSVKLLNLGSAAVLAEQEHWMRAQGPVSSDLLAYLNTQRDNYDAFFFFGYLYATTYFGLPLVRDKAYLVPLGHDEWMIHLNMFDKLFALPRGFVFQTPEEKAFLQKRFSKLELEGPIAGVGVDDTADVRPEVFRARYDLLDPFVLYVGRIDASKGCEAMFDLFMRRSSSVTRSVKHKLVLLGREVLPVPFHDDIISLGFVSEEEKWQAMAACDWLLLPSRYESLSIVLLETWMAGRPAIVNAESEVLRGHCQRSDGGLWFKDWQEVDYMLREIDASTKDRLGRQGRHYVRQYYNWQRIKDAYAGVLSPAAQPLPSATS